MIIRNAFEPDVIAVLDNISDICREELAVFGKEPEDGAEFALRMLKEHGGHAGIVDGEVAAVFGLDHTAQDAVFTWILTTNAFFQQGPSVYKVFRKFMKGIVESQEKPVMAISGSKHPAAARWFTLTGAKPVTKTELFSVFHYG